MNHRSTMPITLLIAILAICAGVLITATDPKWIIAGSLAATTLILVLKDYRFGVLALTILLPWMHSPLLPRAQGFDVINYLILASLISFAINTTRGTVRAVRLPYFFLLCYIIPVIIAGAIAFLYIRQGFVNHPLDRDVFLLQKMGDNPFSPYTFAKDRLIRPAFFVVYAYLLSNAVATSRRPERLIIAYIISAILPALLISGVVLMAGGNVMNRDTFLAPTGFQSNEAGMLLAFAVGPLLFMALGKSGVGFASRVGLWLALLIVSIGLFSTATRGAMVAYGVIVIMMLVKRRRVSDIIFVLLLFAVVSTVMPESVLGRATQGLDDVGATYATNRNDPLTMGRFSGWTLLAPDVLISPLWGRGVGSTAWSTAATSGQYKAGHPHNLYLEVLLDTGFIGLSLIGYAFFRYYKQFKILSRETFIPPTMRDFFSGCGASFIGMLVFGVTNLHYMPCPEQTFLWFALGMSFGFWDLRSTRGYQENDLKHQRSTNSAS